MKWKEHVMSVDEKIMSAVQFFFTVIIL